MPQGGSREDAFTLTAAVSCPLSHCSLLWECWGALGACFLGVGSCWNSGPKGSIHLRCAPRCRSSPVEGPGVRVGVAKGHGLVWACWGCLRGCVGRAFLVCMGSGSVPAADSFPTTSVPGTPEILGTPQCP